MDRSRDNRGRPHGLLPLPLQVLAPLLVAMAVQAPKLLLLLKELLAKLLLSPRPNGAAEHSIALWLMLMLLALLPAVVLL
jgi:hypothetical protein